MHPEGDLSSEKAKEFAVNLDKLQIAEAQKCYQRPADAGTGLQGWRSSFRQSHTFLHYPTLEEAIIEEFRTL